MKPKLDQTDLLILKILQGNAKITNLHLAEYVGLSPASTLERVKKLEQQGLIQSYHAKLNKAKLNLHIHLWLTVRLHTCNRDHVTIFKAAIEQLPEIVSCYQVMGNMDFLLQVVTRDITTYQTFLTQHLSNISVIKEIETNMCLDIIKDTGVPLHHLIH